MLKEQLLVVTVLHVAHVNKKLLLYNTRLCLMKYLRVAVIIFWRKIWRQQVKLLLCAAHGTCVFNFMLPVYLQEESSCPCRFLFVRNTKLFLTFERQANKHKKIRRWRQNKVI